MENELFLFIVFLVGFYCGLPNYDEFQVEPVISFSIASIFGLILLVSVAVWPLFFVFKILVLICCIFLSMYRFYYPFVSVVQQKKNLTN